MGLCNSSGMTDEERKTAQNEADKSKGLERTLNQDHVKESHVNKLLLLGAGESGKSTLFKQMITLYGKGFSESDRATYEVVVYQNTVEAMQCLIRACPEHGGPVACQEEFSAVQRWGTTNTVINTQVGAMIKTLWQDAGIQKCFDNRSNFWLIDSATYYFENIDRISSDDFLPTQQDVLRSRVRTTGITETTFEIDSNQFRMFDVGGQRNERRKWIHCFEKVTALMFVGVLSEYDQMLYEDDNTNRMVETLQLFDEHLNSEWFKKTSVILFLNKSDLFEEKIKRVPLTVCPAFANYEGGNDYAAGCYTIESEFLSKREDDKKEIYSHITCATNTDNVEKVFNDVKDIVIRRGLEIAGLV